MDDIHQLLIELNYPNVNILGEDEVIPLFDAENLPTFLRWFVSELLSDKNMAASYKDRQIIDIICNFGYCTKQQKEGLAKHTLDPCVQYEIIYKMLSNLTAVKKMENLKSVSFEMVTLQQLNELITQKLDLFPHLTGKKSYTDAEREEHITTLEEQIQELEERLASHPQNDENETEEETCEEEKVDLPADENETLEATCEEEKTINNPEDLAEDEETVDLPAAINQFLFSTSDKITELANKMEDSNGTGKEVMKFSDEFANNLEECCKNTLDLEEYFTSLSILDNFKESDALIEVKEPSECAIAVEKLLKLAEEL